MEPADVADRAARWAPRIGATLVGVVAILVVAIVLFDLSLDRVAVDGLADPEQTQRPGDERGAGVGDTGDGSVEADVPGRLTSAVHILVAGSDDRSVLTSEERRELSTGDAFGERTEVLALVRIDPDRDHVDVLRLPRDLLVTRCDGSRGRINAAYGIGERDGTGGSSCLVRTITDWTGIPIHHFVMVDFRGFVDAVDAVGGVEMAFDEPLQDERAGLDVPAGCVRLDGSQALAFVRARHLDDDFGRIGRQQRLVAATMDQILTASTLRDPLRLGQLLTTAQRSLQVDEDMTASRMRAIAATVARLDGEDLVTRTVDGEIRRSNGIDFLYPDEDDAEELFEAFAAGDLQLAPVRADGVRGGDGTLAPATPPDRSSRSTQGQGTASQERELGEPNGGAGDGPHGEADDVDDADPDPPGPGVSC